MADLSGLSLPLLVAAPLALAGLLWLLPRAWAPWLGALLLGGEALALARIAPTATTPHFSLPWIEAWEVSLAFRLDATGWVFAMIVAGVGAAIFAFSSAHMPHHLEERESRRTLRAFCQLLLFFIASMLGVVLADDLITLYVFWELITIASYLLIGFHLRDAEARRAALHSLVITGGSGLFFFASLLLLLHEGGSASIHTLLQHPIAWLAERPTAPLIALGILLTAAAKSVLFPFYGWLPAAMAAPTPVSALLHSATLVASGVYLLTRFLPLLLPLPGTEGLLLVVGASTALVAGATALVRTKLKEVLAWSTISYYGQAMILLGLGAESAALYFFAFHAIAKAGLFLTAGAITQTTGADDLRSLGGLWRTHPILALLTAILGLGLAGFPPAAGFWMKEILFHEVYLGENGWLLAATFGIAFLSVSYFSRLLWCVFFSPARGVIRPPGGAPLTLLLAPGLLAGLFLAAGVPAVGAWLGNPSPLEPLALHVPWPLRPYNYGAILSLPIGLAVFSWFRSRRGLGPGASEAGPRNPDESLRLLAGHIGASRLFEGILTLLGWLGGWASRLQTGRLAHYVAFLVAVPLLAGLVFLPEAIEHVPEPRATSEEAPVLAILTLTLAIVTLALGATVVRSHVSAIVAVGGVGYLLAVLFALLRAPDIAFVQMVVETATALLLLAALSRIPRPLRERVLRVEGRRSRASRAAAAIASGLLGAWLGIALWGAIRLTTEPALGRAFYGLAEAAGSPSVVKAILADFRAMDTLGEITVFTTAVLAAVLLLGRRRERPPRRPHDEAEPREER